jgi:hypothetical protein
MANLGNRSFASALAYEGCSLVGQVRRTSAAIPKQGVANLHNHSVENQMLVAKVSTPQVKTYVLISRQSSTDNEASRRDPNV